MFVPSRNAEALSQGEAPNKEVSERVTHAPPTKLAALLEGVQRGKCSRLATFGPESHA